MNYIYIENSGDFRFGGGVMTVTNAKSSAESEKFTLKIRSESGKLFTIGCHFPPKLTNFGILTVCIGQRFDQTDDGADDGSYVKMQMTLNSLNCS